MSSVFAGPAVSFVNTVLTYFSPAKSPFYSIIAFGTVALVLTCRGIEESLWLWVAIPVFMVLILSTYLSFIDPPNIKKTEHEEQLKFARSFSISIALVFFVLTAQMTDKDEVGFWVSYAASVSQILVFLLYTWARSRSQKLRRNQARMAYSQPG